MNDPQQEMFTAIRQGCVALFGEESVYDSGLPPDGTPYPFVYLADNQFVDDIRNKYQVLGNNYQTIHIWHDNPDERGTVSGMIAEVKAMCRRIRSTPSFSWDFRNADTRILTDTTTKAPLLHAVIEVEHKLTGGSIQ